MSQSTQHQADKFLGQEGVYKEGAMYLGFKLIGVDYQDGYFDFQAEITCDFFFGLKDYAENEKFAFHEGMPRNWGESRIFSFGGSEAYFYEDQISIMYIGYISFNPNKVALFKQKDPDFLDTN